MMLALNDRAVLSVSGPEARGFLQGLVTNNVLDVECGAPRYAALLTPQGKVLFDFLIAEQDGVLLLDCAATLRDALVKRLILYRLRAKIEIAARDDLAVVWQPEGPFSAPFACDPRHPDLQTRAIVSASAAEAAPPGSDAYREVRLNAGVPEGLDFGQDKMFALDADLEELGGIAFDKGCYVGQELTARMKHRGSARKRLLPIASLDGTDLPLEASLRAGTRELGTVQSVYGARGFALIRLDRWQEAEGAAVFADTIAVRIRKPEWLFS